jgi:hypothetical protein
MPDSLSDPLPRLFAQALRTVVAGSLLAACTASDPGPTAEQTAAVKPTIAGVTTKSVPASTEHPIARTQTGHPLDPLRPSEISAAVAAVQAAGYNSPTTYIPVVRLQEPAKADVLAWQPGQPYKREAFLVVFEDVPPSGRTHEIVVSLDGNPRIKSDTLKPGVQPPVLNAEYGIAIGAPFSDQRFQNALIARGYGPSTWNGLFCAPLSAGNYGIPSEAGKRLFRVTCLDAASTTNPWSRPLENLTAVVDLVSQTVIDVVDTGVVPMSASNGDFYNVAQAPAQKPISVVAPQGDDYRVDGHVLTSPRWQLHFKVEGRDGIMISQIKYNDHGNLRSVMYRANLSETFVPYADPTSNFYYRTYMDEGEYGFGKSTQPLTRTRTARRTRRSSTRRSPTTTATRSPFPMRCACSSRRSTCRITTQTCSRATRRSHARRATSRCATRRSSATTTTSSTGRSTTTAASVCASARVARSRPRDSPSTRSPTPPARTTSSGDRSSMTGWVARTTSTSSTSASTWTSTAPTTRSSSSRRRSCWRAIRGATARAAGPSCRCRRRSRDRSIPRRTRR